MNKYICFDIGNVLVDVDLEKFTKNVSSLNISKSEAWRLLEKLQPLQDIGLTDIKHFFQSERQINGRDSLDWITELWLTTVQPNQSMLNFVQNRLLPQGYQIILVSNIGVDHADHLRMHSLTQEIFNQCEQHFSFEVGARKPQKLYFQSLLWEFPECKNCLFIDDRPENLAMAQVFGFKSFHFSLEELRNNQADLERKLDKIQSKLDEIQYD